MSSPANPEMTSRDCQKLSVTISVRPSPRSRVSMWAPWFPGVSRYCAMPVSSMYAT